MAISIEEKVRKFKNSNIFKGSVLLNEPLASHTTMKVGGNAEIFLIPENVESAIYALTECINSGTKYFVLGNGSNVVFSDAEFNGVVISTQALTHISVSYSGKTEPYAVHLCPKVKNATDILITCESGVLFSQINEFCAENGILGLETFAGLPASCGGAAFMNARCYSTDAASLIEYVEYLDLDEFSAIGQNSSIKVDSLLKMYHNIEGNKDWDYKLSPFTGKNVLITRVTFRAKALLPDWCNVQPDEEIKTFIRNENQKFIEDRTAKGHFKAPSAGSVFKNNRSFGSPSGKLIDEAGLKGTQVGGAQIAPWHGNFIINNGNATASDIKQLVQMAKDKVFQQTGFKLECEILFV